MQHVDEGDLHAYLDGALDALPASEAARIRQHLAACEVCGRRLEEERALRAEAEAILAGADPGAADMPPLEELRQRAFARVRTDSGIRLRRLTWAASLVMAVGAGWMLRGAQAPRLSESLSPALRESPVEQGPGGAAARSAEAPKDAAAEAGTTTATRAGGVGGVEQTRSAERLAGAGPSAGAGEAAPDRPRPAAESVVLEAQAPRPRTADAIEAEEKAAPPPPATFVRDTAEDSLRRTLAAARAQVALVLADTVRPLVAPSAPAVSGARADVASEFAARVRAMPRAGEPEMARYAEEDLSSIAVPGLPVLALTGGDRDLPAGALRVLQLFEGDTLELIHLPAGSDPGSVPRPDGGRTQVAVRYGAGWLVGRARAPREAVETLLARVTSGR
jgi:anti-sigma factor RsiW